MAWARASAALAVVAGLSGCGRESPGAEARTAAEARPAGRPATERLATLERSLRAVTDGERDAPRDRWDPAYVVERVGRSPDVLRTWVQENTSWIPYRGALRGPVGVLMDRQANGLDRALLLARLLAEAGHAARLAHAELPAEQAVRLLPDLVARRSSFALDTSALAGPPASPVGEIAAGYGLDGNAIQRTLDAYQAATARLHSDLRDRVIGQTTQLLSALSAPDPASEWNTRRDSALAVLRDYWWVQVRSGDSWLDLDLLDSAATAGTAPRAPSETLAPSELAPSLLHRLAIRVIEERLTAGALTERTVLERTLRPSELIGQPVVLQFWPTQWPDHPASDGDPSRGTRRLALEQDEWSAVLTVGSDVAARTVLAASAGSRPRASDALGGLGGAIAGSLGPGKQSGPDEQDGLLTAAWIEYQITVPGRSPRIVRRRVFDLIGPAAREARSPALRIVLDEAQRLTRSLSLMMRTEILPVATQLAPEFVLHLAGRELLANAALLRAVGRPGFGSDQRATDALLRQAEPGPTPLYTLAVLRQDALGVLGFIDRPAVLTRHQYPMLRGGGIAVEDATDIVANEVGVDLAESDGFAARLAQGVWDTNLEALLGPGSRPSANTALAYAASGDWRVLTTAHTGRPASALPADAAALLHGELDSGYTVVAPVKPVPFQADSFVGWWRIHPETGDALGIAGNGWGQGAPDYGMHVAAFVEMAKPFVFTYALCQYIPQAANSLNILGGEFWARGLSPSWTTAPAPGKDFEDVAAENHRRCVIEAIIGGFVATAPLLMRTLMYRTEAELAAELRLGRARPGTMPSIPRPAGTSPRPKGYPSPGGPAPRGGPSGTLAGGARPSADPFGKTQPGPRPTKPGPPPVPTKAGPPPTPRPSPGSPKPTPMSPEQARENLKRALEAQAEAQGASTQATGDYTRYRANMPNPGRGHEGDPANWDPEVDAEMQKNMWDKQQENIERINDLRAAQRAARDATAAARGAEGRGGLQAPNAPPRPEPNVPICPPNCAGNNNPTGPAGEVQLQGASPAGALEVGSAGVASSLSGSGQ